MQLKNGAAHQRMRRQCVRAVCAFVDQHHSRTRSCEQEGSCRPAAARSDDDGINSHG